MTATNARPVAEALRRLGQAYRMDWSDFDGRSLRCELGELADALTSDNPFDLDRWTFTSNICPVSGGWFEHCDERSEGVHIYSCDHNEAWVAKTYPQASNGSEATQ